MKMKLLRGYFRAKGLLEDFAKEERGAADIIAIILIIAVVVTLAGIFRKQITEIVESLTIPASQISSLPSKAATATIPLSRVRT